LAVDFSRGTHLLSRPRRAKQGNHQLVYSSFELSAAKKWNPSLTFPRQRQRKL